MAGPSEGMSAAGSGRGGGGATAEAKTILRAAVSPVQEKDAVGSTQPGAGSSKRGNYNFDATEIVLHVMVFMFLHVFLLCGSSLIHYSSRFVIGPEQEADPEGSGMRHASPAPRVHPGGGVQTTGLGATHKG